jgi:hypothetical protein
MFRVRFNPGLRLSAHTKYQTALEGVIDVVRFGRRVPMDHLRRRKSASDARWENWLFGRHMPE